MTESSHVVRTFIAIPLPDSVKQFLSDIQSGLKSAGLRAAWSHPDTFHLTLRFLGPTSKEQLMAIESGMATFSGAYPAFTLTSGTIGVFPDIRKARVVWSGIHGQTECLTQLVTDLNKTLHAIGIPAPSRPFFPHITLARIKKPVRPGVLTPLIHRFQTPISPAFPVTHLVFYQSRLLPEGAKHVSLCRTRLTR